MESAQVGNATRRSFWLGKLFSLVGLVPLGIYVVMHLYQNLSSIYGAERFNAYLAEARSKPMIVPIMVILIWIPIMFHGIYGLFRIKESRPNLTRFPFLENLKYVCQRLSGIGLLLFIPAHIFKTRIEPWLSGTPLDFHHMVEGMHEPITLPVYLLGVLGATYHLSNGLWQFAIGWGLITTAKSMKWFQNFVILFFLLLTAVGYAAIWGFFQSPM